jgi:hypothetical protein
MNRSGEIFRDTISYLDFIFFILRNSLLFNHFLLLVLWSAELGECAIGYLAYDSALWLLPEFSTPQYPASVRLRSTISMTLPNLLCSTSSSSSLTTLPLGNNHLRIPIHTFISEHI